MRLPAFQIWRLWYVCLVIVAVTGPPTAREDDRPNVLLIIVDDQGYSDLNADPLGRAADVDIPNIDRLVRQGALFRNAYATSPICSPSRAAISTGRYQQRWGNNLRDDVGERENVADEHPGVVRALRARYAEWRELVEIDTDE